MADYDVEAFIQKRNARMAQSSNANQQAAQSMRAAGIANVGGKAITSSARDIQERFGSSKTRGLGSRKNTAIVDTEEEDVGGVKSFMDSIFNWFNASGASEPKMPPSYDGSSVYERSEFDIRPTPVTSSVLDAAPTGYDPYGIDTLNFGKGVDTNTDTAPETPETAKTDVFDPLNMKEKVQRDSETPGLMTPPSAEQPSVTGGKSLLTEAPETIRKTIESIMLTDPDVPYVIQAGDTLSEIAAKTGTTVNELQKLNKIKKANEIFAGDELIIPSNKSTKTKEDIVSSLIGGMGGVSELGSSFEGDGVQTASSGEILSDATYKDGIMRPKIRPGSTEKEVKQAQKILDNLGYEAGGADGKIGGGTKRAIRKFQKQHGLDVTGELDPNTFKKITSDNVENYPDPPKKDAKVIDFSESDFYIFKEAVAGKESGSHGYSTYAFDIPSENIKKGDPLKGGANKHYLGKYQMGEDALSDVGIKYNATSIKKYLNSPEQQEKAFKEYTEKNHKELTQKSQAYREMTPKEKLAVLGYAHNQGATAAVEFLFTGVSGKDAFGTKGKEYIGLVTDAFSRNQPIPRPQPRPENL